MADRDCVHGQLARAEFEKWVKNPHMLGRCHAPGSEDRYEVSETQYAWRAWQAAIAAYRDAEAKRSDRCEHCGSIVTSYRSGCPGCGAPQCCQRCCDKAEIERLNENIKTLLANHQTVRAKLEAAERDARAWHNIWAAEPCDLKDLGGCGPVHLCQPCESRRKIKFDEAARGGEHG